MRADWLHLLREDQKTTYGLDPALMPHFQLLEYIRSMGLGLVDETMELVHEFPWKPWKRPEPIDPEAVAFEAADILHFFGHLLNVAGVSDEQLEAAFMEKRRINARRQAEGY